MKKQVENWMTHNKFTLMTKKLTSLFLAVCLAFPLLAQVRGKIDIPDLNGYITLKCDFHTHTVFSDGLVWPTVRVDEAYREGLDAVAITDHIEFRPHEEIVASRNRSYEIAQKRAEDKGIILIQGSEITRKMPPGHHNAIFITDAEKLDTTEYLDAFRAAKAQDAFIFWNHPHWDRQQHDTTLWMEEHTQLFQQGLMHGIEVVNHFYCPEAHRWCWEKKLALLGNSDMQQPIQAHVNFAAGKHRAMTFVFAKSATIEGIREALFERRTAVYHDEYVIGEEKYLKELFENALEWKTEKVDSVTMRLIVKNKSDLSFRLKKTQHDTRLVYFRETTIVPHGEHTFTIKLQDGIQGGDINFIVENFFVEPNKGMKYTVKI
jgi:hypothetical protein